MNSYEKRSLYCTICQSLAIYKTIKYLTLNTEIRSQNLNVILLMSSRSRGCEEFLTVSDFQMQLLVSASKLVGCLAEVLAIVTRFDIHQ